MNEQIGFYNTCLAYAGLMLFMSIVYDAYLAYARLIRRVYYQEPVLEAVQLTTISSDGRKDHRKREKPADENTHDAENMKSVLEQSYSRLSQSISRI